MELYYNKPASKLTYNASTFFSNSSSRESNILRIGMIGDVVPDSYQTEPLVKSNRIGGNIHKSQETIYRFLLGIINDLSPEIVLLTFKRLFVYYEPDSSNANALKALSDIIFDKNEEEFRNTLKRCCYILINNWDSTRQYKYITELVELFLEFKSSKKTLSPTLSVVRLWLTNFVNSEDYQQLRLFVARYETNDKAHWSHRYTSYLLVPQYVNLQNSVEQREAARTLSQQLKNRFKFDLAMYTARSQSSISKEKIPKNPTNLGNEVLRLIKTLVAKQGAFSHTNLANIFIKQTDQLLYKDYKQSIKKYLLLNLQNPGFAEILNQKLSDNLEDLYKDYHEEVINDALRLRTCNRIIEYLTTENRAEPSQLFIILMSHGNPLTLVVVMLKIILISKNSRTHLEKCIAELIQYYINFPEEECKWIISFLDVFNITFAIYADNVQYNVVKVKNKSIDEKSDGMETYRIFSQMKWDANLGVEPEAAPEMNDEEFDLFDE